MAGHSKFKNIQHRKGAQDKKRAKVFTRLIKELAVAARAGTDPDANPRLRTALAGCRAANMPKDNVERVLKRAEGGEGELYEEIRYEGYGTGGTAFIVEALTDNRNRTGSVSFMFDKVGEMIFDASAGDADTVFEVALEAGADNVESDEDVHVITTNPEDFNAVRESLDAAFGAPQEAQLTWIAQNSVDVDEGHAQTLLKFVDTLDDNEDVQNIAFNFEISDEIMAKLEG